MLPTFRDGRRMEKPKRMRNDHVLILFKGSVTRICLVSKRNPSVREKKRFVENRELERYTKENGDQSNLCKDSAFGRQSLRNLHVGEKADGKAAIAVYLSLAWWGRGAEPQGPNFEVHPNF